MKTFLTSVFVALALNSVWASTSINTTNKFSYGANLGWMDWRGDTNSGAVIGEYICSGYIWAANVGWIHLGSNAPANGIQYQNNSATDYGVNHDGQGNLRGYAYGANIGWINFENLGAPKVDLATGKLSGSVYSANCGWISLSNTFAVVQTDHIKPGVDTDGDGITDAWELTYTNSLTAFTSTSDTDGDGVSDKEEYLADTNPLDPNDLLRITAYSVQFFTADTDTVVWTSRPTRRYQIQHRTSLDANVAWETFSTTFDPSPDPTTTAVIGFATPTPQRFLRVQAIKPLP